jgi:ATP-dependent exoDNAse (exonuclease V) alpha subunit
VTSHSSQGQTADRVLVNVDTQRSGEKLVNRRLAYVAVSRGRYDALIYTNDKTQLAEGLGRDASHRTATETRQEPVVPAKGEALELERERERTRTQSYSIGR